jgi:hypothetical protein
MKTTIVALLALGLLACRGEAGGSAPTGPALSPQRAADMLHAVLAADREVYTKQVVNRLTLEQRAITASENWKTEHGTLPLPAQMFRMGAETVAAADAGFTYVLLSPWPVNKQNRAKTKLEKTALQQVVDSAKPFYGEETLGGATYFTAIYPDVAVAAACVDCHNGHADSPRRDFEVGDVMGGVVIRIPL